MTASVLLGGASTAAAATDVSVKGVLHQGERGQVVYEAIKPASWNGTLVLDLDFNNWNPAQRQWFLSHGYAIGGNQRTQNETAYELHDYVDNLVETRSLLMKAVSAADGEPSEPTRTIAFGASRGSFVSRMAVEYRPDVFDAAVAFAGGGAGVIGSWLGKTDSVWALKQLVDPSSRLAISGLPDSPTGEYGATYDQDVALGQLVGTASATPQGMARLVLAAAFEQATGWPSGPEPAATDYETQGKAIAGSFAFGNPQFVLKEIEIMGGGPVTWNHDVDYADLLQRSGALDRVQWWYDHAGLDLQADLATLAGAPRFAASPEAVSTVEGIGTFSGRTGGAPVFSVKTIGDSADSVSLDTAYQQTMRSAGNENLLRSAFIERPGHSSQSLVEKLAAFQTVVDRLDTGEWPNTSAAALNTRAQQIAATLPASAGDSRFIEYSPAPALRTWDFTNWGSYPYPAATAASPGELTPSTRDSVTVAAGSAAPGSDVEVDLGEQRAGQWVSVWLYSPARQLGGWLWVGADGAVTVSLPADATPAKHRLAVLDHEGTVLGWSDLKVTPPGHR
ncbi:hypothetical protein [Petropleomorpha daqingensis]|uniref:hypothetical protein n=1 Tax=Petropleomorpha daqingensis TaxID=2026353 RepID=UPI0015C6B9FA|nr:hypothetical protein [Petropleomorpha daqingensis]